MTTPHFSLFEVSWEVCNKVGGIHTVLSTKAQTMVDRLGDDYVAIGPWMLAEAESSRTFADEPGFEEFSESCRQMGVPVRVGRWLIPGRPRTVLVEFSGLLAQKDDILTRLWESYRVDSLRGSWDYIEPVLFGYASGLVIEKWIDTFALVGARPLVAQFHEWMTGSGLLYLKRHAPEVGTVFTTHATMLGRSLASRGNEPLAVVQESWDTAAAELGIPAKHSMEGVCAREADVFTTVSQITAHEAERFHGRMAVPLLPNGIDLDVVDQLSGHATRDGMTTELTRFAHRFLGEPIDGAALLCISGRYEFHNKGMDILLDVLGLLNRRDGRPAVLFVLVPAGHSGPNAELLDRLRRPEAGDDGPMGLSTHNLFDPDHDPVLVRCRAVGLTNAPGSRIKVILVPAYLNGMDGVLNLVYEAVLTAMDLSVFPSFYEPWGYTPVESLALGVPTVTTDLAGFGIWALDLGLRPEDGVWVLGRHGVDDATATDKLATIVDAHLADPGDRATLAQSCRDSARRASWSDLISHYEAAFELARESAAERMASGEHRVRRRFPMVRVAAETVSQRPRLHRFDVASTVPSELEPLERLSRNLWWSWNHDAADLFAEISPSRWAECRHNPVQLLDQVPAAELRRLIADDEYIARLHAVARRFDDYMARPQDAGAHVSERHPVAYYSAEFGLHESLPIYSGGLGILAGDHLKSASDLGVPLIGVGLFYRRSRYQRLSRSGEQTFVDRDNDPTSLPLELVCDDRGRPLEIALSLPSSELVLNAWRVMVGRVTLYLLDSDVAANRPEDRTITHWLYGGDQEDRLRQEIVLGRGGARLLARLGIEPSVHHLNEGHAAFVVLERLARRTHEEGLTIDEAQELVRATTAFTTHTPVPAGHDRFTESLIRRYFSNVDTSIGIPWDRFFALGRGDGGDEMFNMTYLAARFAGFINGVSRLHGRVSRAVLHPVWPMMLEAEVPVDSITNGVHLATWTDPETARALGAVDRPVTGDDFAKAELVSLDDLWQLRERRHARLREILSQRMQLAFLRRHEDLALMSQMRAGLSGNPMFIGFARRFAPYKRADLVLRDPQRLLAILDDPEQPVRLLFAGKAHPADGHGQEILRRVVELSRSAAFVGKILFLEDYDFELGRALAHGVDLWLNNPIRPLEASGTSGMKIAASGGLNLSIADGWWDEAKNDDNGWTIGDVAPVSAEVRDELEASHLYQLLEAEVKPLFFDRDDRGVPGGWLRRVQHSLKSIPPTFNTARMVTDYLERCYDPLASSFHALRAADRSRLHSATAEHQRVRRGFGEVGIVAVELSDLRDIKVMDTIEAHVTIDLGSLRLDDLQVELVHGQAQRDHVIDEPQFVILSTDTDGHSEGSRVTFAGSAVVAHSGPFACGIRVRARQHDPWDRSLCDLMLWAEGTPGA